MQFSFAVLLPLFLQVLFTAAIVLATNGTGSFVGLGALLLGFFAIPITAIFNWLGTRAQPALPVIQLVTRTTYMTLVYPALILILYAVAS